MKACCCFLPVDFNECADASTNDCDQDCTNNLGSYTCSCQDGYILAGDNKDCLGMYVAYTVSLKKSKFFVDHDC